MELRLLFVVMILCCSSVSITGLVTDEETQKYSLSFSFSKPCVVEQGATVQLVMEGANACLYQSGQPVLPMATTTIQLPFGSIVKDVTISFTHLLTMSLHKKITHVPTPQALSAGGKQQKTMTIQDSALSNKNDYPSGWMTFVTGGGLNEHGKHVTFLTIRVFPVRYNEADDIVSYLDGCDIMITYEEPTQYPFPSHITNDLIIICPTRFLLPLQRLAEHKNTVGVRTEIKTTEEIYQAYPGFDRPEQIKLFIKDAIERWGTSYVLLVGGLNSHLIAKPRDDVNKGTRDWYVPVRYSNLLDDDAIYDPGFISDLYYADIYDGQGSFCSWNSFEDGVYGSWSHSSSFNHQDDHTDQIDFYPDIYLGRLPCRNLLEVMTVVRKIISYEQNPADPSWFNRMVVVAGDPYDDQGTNYLEGELIAEKVLSFMTGVEPRKLFSSNKETKPAFTPTTDNIVREINQGCGFLFFDGHGSPYSWNTFWPGEFDELIEDGGLSVAQFYRLQNQGKFPVCIVGGCHNNLFNVSVFSTITDPWNKRSSWSNGFPVPECWGWSLVIKPTGGAIATIGNTGLGYEAGGELGDLDGDGINEPDCVESLCGFLETRFFKAYQLHHIDTLGKTWGHAIIEYLRVYPGMEQWSDAKTLEQWVLFGDPSLKIGGYA